MLSLWLLRLGFIAGGVVLAALVVARPRAAGRAIGRFLLEPQPPINLALLRVLVFTSLFIEALDGSASWFATLPAYFMTPLPGWEWLDGSLPIPASWVAPAEWALRVACLLAALGLFTRPAAAVATLLGLVIFLIPNLYFKVGHGHQVLVQQAAVLAASRAGDAFSLDAWFRRARGLPAPVPDAAYTLPVRLCWLLMGTMYFFPGAFKLWNAGDLWVSGAQLRHEITVKWGHTPDYVPWLRVDHLPVVLAVLGTATLVIELGFLFSLFWRGSRVVAALLVAGFHLGIGLTMGIWFSPIHPLIVLLDYPHLLEHPVFQRLKRLRRLLDRRGQPAPALDPGAPPEPAPSSAASPGTVVRLPRRLVAVVGGTCVAGMLLTGAFGVNSFPFSVYPRFANRQKRVVKSRKVLEFVCRSADGKRRTLSPRFPQVVDTAAVYRIGKPLLVSKKRRDPVVFERHVALLTRMVRENEGPFRAGDWLEIYSYDLVLDPDRRKANPKRRLVALRRL